MEKQKNNLAFINYLRFFAMISIVLCHLVQLSTNPMVSNSSQLFNLAVPVFIIISGFCFGLQGKIENWKKWYFKRLVRIYIPYEMFLIFIIVGFLIKKVSLAPFKEGVITCLFGVQGANVGLPGAEHTWYITAVLLFYIATPLFSLLWSKASSKNVKIIAVVAMVIAYGASVLIFGDLSPVVSPIFMYFLAFVMGYEYNGARPKINHLIIGLSGFFGGFAIRFGARMIFDSQSVYMVFVGISQYAIAFGVAFAFFFIFRNAKGSKALKFFNKISFEVYLFHYCFIFGPYFIYNDTPFKWLDIILIVVATFVSAYICNVLSTAITKKLKI